MAMKLLLKVTLDARDVREACALWARERIGSAEEQTFATLGVPDDLSVTVEVRKAPAPRKPKSNGVASAGELSDAERRFA